MKLFGKRTETKASTDTTTGPAPAGKVVVGGKGVKNGVYQSASGLTTKLKRSGKKLLRTLGFVVLLVIVGAGLVVLGKNINNKNRASTTEKELKSVNEALIENNDTEKALEHARKALENDPDNVDTILTVAGLAATINPAESKQLYVRAYETFKKQENLDGKDTKNAVTYWAAAQLAYDADKIEDAKKYYQMVIDTADKSDAYHMDIAKQSQERLKGLQ